MSGIWIQVYWFQSWCSALYLAYSFFYTRNSIRIPEVPIRKSSWLSSWSFKHIHYLTTSHDPPLLLNLSHHDLLAGPFAVSSCVASPLPPLPAPQSAPAGWSVILKHNPCHLLLCSKSSCVFHLFQSKIMSSYDLPCSDCKHFTLPCPHPCYFSGLLAVPQTLQAQSGPWHLLFFSLRLFIQVSFWLALSLHCNLCLYVIISHIRYHIRGPFLITCSNLTPITSILHSGLFPFFLFIITANLIDILTICL